MLADHQGFPEDPGAERPGGGRRRRTGRRNRRRKRILIGVAAGMAFVLLLAGGVAWWVYDRLDGNIKTEDFAAKLGDKGRPLPTGALNILLVGTDTREGENAAYGSDGGGSQRSDTTILLHVPEGRRNALGVSFPRDLMVDVPACGKPAGGTSEPYFGMFNSAMSVGGTACTISTVEHLTGVRVDHQITVDFVGFKKLVDALGGVPIHLDQPIDDQAARLNVPAGDVTLNGEQALGFVRVRKSLGDGSDIQRIQRQQLFLNAMIGKVKKESLLTNPARMYNILDTATKAITTDPALGSLSDLYSLLASLRNIPESAVAFETVPTTSYQRDPNRVAMVRPEADVLFARLRDESAAVLPAPTASPAPASGREPAADDR